MTLKSRIERLERDHSRNPAPPMIWMNEGESVEEARAKAGLQPDDPVIVVRWRSEAEEQQQAGGRAGAKSGHFGSPHESR